MTKKRVKKECSIKNKRGGYPLNDRQRVSQTNNLRHSFFAKRQMPNKREGVVIILYSSYPFTSIPINNYIYNIGCVFFLISYLAFGAFGASSSAVFHVSCNTICLFLHRNYVAPTEVITMKACPPNESQVFLLCQTRWEAKGANFVKGDEDSRCLP